MKRFFVLMLALIMCMTCLVSCGKDEAKPNDTDNPTTQGNRPETPPRPDCEMSDNVEDFTIRINGLVYDLPCDMSLVLNDGWIPKSGYVLEDDYKIPSGDVRKVVIYSEEKSNMVTVSSYYSAEGESAYRDGTVFGFCSEENSTAEIEITGGLTLDKSLTLQDVVNVFGDNYTHTTDYDGDRYVYRYDNKGLYIFVFLDGQLNYWELRMYKEDLQ